MNKIIVMTEEKRTRDVKLEQMEIEELRKYIKKNGAYSICIINRTDLPLDMVKELYATEWLKYVKNQTNEMCSEAVKNNGRMLQYVKEQTPEICLDAVKENGMALKYVINQSDDICKEAIKQNPYSIQYVKNQTNELCLLAVSLGSVIAYIDKNIRTEEMYEIMVKNEPSSISMFSEKEQSEKLCHISLEASNYSSIKYIKNPTHDMCMNAIKHNPNLLEYIKNQTVEMQQLALSMSKSAFIDVINPSYEMCKEAVSRDLYYIRFVEDDDMKLKILSELKYI